MVFFFDSLPTVPPFLRASASPREPLHRAFQTDPLPVPPAVDNRGRFAYIEGSDAGWSSLVARWAHNPKVAGSNPAPATTLKFCKAVRKGGLFFGSGVARSREAREGDSRESPRPIRHIRPHPENEHSHERPGAAGIGLVGWGRPPRQPLPSKWSEGAPTVRRVGRVRQVRRVRLPRGHWPPGRQAGK